MTDRNLVVPTECRRALESQKTTPGRRAMLGGIELPVLFAIFFVFMFPFLTSEILCKPGVENSSPLPECFQKIEKNFYDLIPCKILHSGLGSGHLSEVPERLSRLNHHTYFC